MLSNTVWYVISLFSLISSSYRSFPVSAQIFLSFLLVTPTLIILLLMGIQDIPVMYNTPMHIQVFTPLYTQARTSPGVIYIHFLGQLTK